MQWILKGRLDTSKVIQKTQQSLINKMKIKK